MPAGSCKLQTPRCLRRPSFGQMMQPRALNIELPGHPLGLLLDLVPDPLARTADCARGAANHAPSPSLLALAYSSSVPRAILTIPVFVDHGPAPGGASSWRPILLEPSAPGQPGRLAPCSRGSPDAVDDRTAAAHPDRHTAAMHAASPCRAPMAAAAQPPCPPACAPRRPAAPHTTCSSGHRRNRQRRSPTCSAALRLKILSRQRIARRIRHQTDTSSSEPYTSYLPLFSASRSSSPSVIGSRGPSKLASCAVGSSPALRPRSE